MKDIFVLLVTMGGGLGCFLLGMKHLSAGRHLREPALAELSVVSKGLRHAIRAARECQLQRIGGDESAPLVALATLDVFNALDRARSCLINIAETLAGGKRTDSV